MKRAMGMRKGQRTMIGDDGSGFSTMAVKMTARMMDAMSHLPKILTDSLSETPWMGMMPSFLLLFFEIIGCLDFI